MYHQCLTGMAHKKCVHKSGIAGVSWSCCRHWAGIVFALQDNQIGGRSGQADMITSGEDVSTDDVSRDSNVDSSKTNNAISPGTSGESVVFVQEQSNVTKNISINIFHVNRTTSSPSSSPT
jgi:hypothetical protein